MNYGPNAKTLGKLARNPKLYVIPDEQLDIDGWYSDGQNDAMSGRKRSFGSCTIPENQAAYLSGYDSILALDKFPRVDYTLGNGKNNKR